MWRVRSVLRNCAPGDAFEIILDAASQPSWNRYCAKIIEHDSQHGALLLQSCFKGMFPIAAREGLEFRATSSNASTETYQIGFSSIGTENLTIPVQPKHERSFTTLSGYCFQMGPQPNTVSFTFVSHVDAGGGLPDWMVAKAGAKGPLDLCKDLQSVINKKFGNR